jgi:hypothetical protein
MVANRNKTMHRMELKVKIYTKNYELSHSYVCCDCIFFDKIMRYQITHIKKETRIKLTKEYNHKTISELTILFEHILHDYVFIRNLFENKLRNWNVGIYLNK